MRRIRLSALHIASEYRPPGYYDDVVSRGTIDGEHLMIEDDAYRELVEKYNPQPKRGLGDIVASVAQPIARAIDRVIGSNLADCGGCKKRQEWLNDHVHL